MPASVEGVLAFARNPKNATGLVTAFAVGGAIGLVARHYLKKENGHSDDDGQYNDATLTSQGMTTQNRGSNESFGETFTNFFTHYGNSLAKGNDVAIGVTIAIVAVLLLCAYMAVNKVLNSNRPSVK